MNYLGEKIKKLGFGLMRLPRNSEGIDIPHFCAMVDAFLDAGFTYFDTAYVYQGSEEATRVALVERHPRDAYQLASKLPAWAAKNADDARAIFETSLNRTGAGYFDYYLLHNLGGNRTRSFEEYRLWEFALELKERGLIRHLGFSMHDGAEHLDEILTRHPEAEFVQLQINYADWEDDDVQSRRCYETARKHGKPIIIMEPVKGGLLASPPAAVAELLGALSPGASMSSFALRYAASLEGVITVLSGMSNLAQMEDNLRTFTDFRPLDAAEREAMLRAQDIFASAKTIPCTNCKYCVKDCPQNIAIPGILEAINKYIVYENLSAARRKYAGGTKNAGAAGDCVGCGRCEEVCPQHIEIISELRRAAELFGK